MLLGQTQVTAAIFVVDSFAEVANEGFRGGVERHVGYGLVYTGGRDADDVRGRVGGYMCVYKASCEGDQGGHVELHELRVACSIDLVEAAEVSQANVGDGNVDRAVGRRRGP